MIRKWIIYLGLLLLSAPAFSFSQVEIGLNKGQFMSILPSTHSIIDYDESNRLAGVFLHLGEAKGRVWGTMLSVEITDTALGSRFRITEKQIFSKKLENKDNASFNFVARLPAGITEERGEFERDPAFLIEGHAIEDSNAIVIDLPVGAQRDQIESIKFLPVNRDAIKLSGIYQGLVDGTGFHRNLDPYKKEASISVSLLRRGAKSASISVEAFPGSSEEYMSAYFPSAKLSITDGETVEVESENDTGASLTGRIVNGRFRGSVTFVSDESSPLTTGFYADFFGEKWNTIPHTKRIRASRTRGDIFANVTYAALDETIFTYIYGVEIKSIMPGTLILVQNRGEWLPIVFSEDLAFGFPTQFGLRSYILNLKPKMRVKMFVVFPNGQTDIFRLKVQKDGYDFK